MSGDFDFLDVDIKVTSDLLESISFCDNGIGIMSIDTEEMILLFFEVLVVISLW